MIEIWTDEQIEIEGQDYLEKVVSRQSDTAGKIYLPSAWIGRRVAVILLDALDELGSYQANPRDFSRGIQP